MPNPGDAEFNQNDPGTWSPQFQQQVISEVRQDDVGRFQELSKRFGMNSGRMLLHVTRTSPNLVRRAVTNFNTRRRSAVRGRLMT